MSRQIDELLTKQMDRRDFIKHLGVGMMALFGIGTIVKMLLPIEKAPSATVSTTTTSSSNSTTRSTAQALAYGGGTYGGKRVN
ncbi:MAG: hypothetical protein PVI21_00250 [Candidatus Woesebacteria bacterium]|jgi:hypothetical protein